MFGWDGRRRKRADCASAVHLSVRHHAVRPILRGNKEIIAIAKNAFDETRNFQESKNPISKNSDRRNWIKKSMIATKISPPSRTTLSTSRKLPASLWD